MHAVPGLLFSLQMLNTNLPCWCRVYGKKVAELPLVGTRFVHRLQGMCRLLINQLEKVCLKVGSTSVLLAPDIVFHGEITELTIMLVVAVLSAAWRVRRGEACATGGA